MKPSEITKLKAENTRLKNRVKRFKTLYISEIKFNNQLTFRLEQIRRIVDGQEI